MLILKYSNVMIMLLILVFEHGTTTNSQEPDVAQHVWLGHEHSSVQW